jgi:hypothetical protein
MLSETSTEAALALPVVSPPTKPAKVSDIDHSWTVDSLKKYRTKQGNEHPRLPLIQKHRAMACDLMIAVHSWYAQHTSLQKMLMHSRTLWFDAAMFTIKPDGIMQPQKHRFAR